MTHRAFGIVAHVDAGKTTLSERILFHTGRIHRMTEVHHGGATTDPLAVEQRHGISVTAAATRTAWRDAQLTLIDTPGHVDFAVEVERSLRVLDGAVLVLDAVAGVQAQTRAVFRRLRRYEVPTIALVNKADKVGADPPRVILDMQEQLGVQTAPLQLALGLGSELRGVIDLVHMRVVRFEGEHGERVVFEAIPESEMARARLARERLLDAASLHSDALLEHWLAEDEVPAELVLDAVRAGVLACELVPVLTGSAYRNIGVQTLLDAAVDLLPAPEDRVRVARTGAGEPVDLVVDPDAELVGFVFKRQETAHGSLSWIRVLQGSLKAGQKVQVAGQTLRTPRLVVPDVTGQELVDTVGAGHIGALVGVGLRTGATVQALGSDLALAGLEIPEPVVEVAVHHVGGRFDRLGPALRRLAAEDPSLQVESDAESGELRLRGMGELHLSIVAERLEEASGVQIRLSPPRVALRQTLPDAQAFSHTLRKQNGGVGLYARLIGRVEPIEGLGVETCITAGRDVVPEAYRSGIARAVSSFCADQDIPWVGLRVVIEDGDVHSKDSSESAFELCMRDILVNLTEQAQAHVLEPRMRVEVEAPESQHGSVLRSLGRRNAMITDSLVDALESRVVADVPLAAMFGYASDLRSATGGEGSFTMSFLRYAQRR